MSDNMAASHPESAKPPEEGQGEKATSDTTTLRVSTAEDEGKRGTINVTEDQAARSDDCSDLTDNNNESDDQVVKTFPQKLMDVLQVPSYRHIVSWLDHGNGFVIHKKKTFASEVLPVYFKATKFTSFTRKLNRWGFQRVPRGPETGAYYHKSFRRDDPDQVQQMASNSGSKYNALPHHLLPDGMIPGLMAGVPGGAMGMLPFLALPGAAAAAAALPGVLSQPQQQVLLQHQMHQMLQFQQVLQMQQQAMTAAAAAAAVAAATTAMHNNTAAAANPPTTEAPQPPQPSALLQNPALLNPMVAMMMMQQQQQQQQQQLQQQLQQQQQQFFQTPPLLAPMSQGPTGVVPLLPSLSGERGGAGVTPATPVPPTQEEQLESVGEIGTSSEEHDPLLSPDALSSPTGDHVLQEEEV